MKNIIRNPLGFVVLICNVAFLISCNKHNTTTPVAAAPPVTTDIANGLPDDPKKIHGYIYAANYIYFYSINMNQNVKNVFQFAMFGDPSRNLMANYDHFGPGPTFGSSNDVGNVSVGDLFFNGTLLDCRGNINYMQMSTEASSLSTSASWMSSGNLSFRPLDLTVPRGFPIIIRPTDTTISVSKDFTIDFSKFISNYDSVIVGFVDHSSSSGQQHRITKRISSNSSSITFTKAELSVLNTSGYGSIIFSANNYSNKIIEDKIYVFELTSRMDMSLIVSP